MMTTHDQNLVQVIRASPALGEIVQELTSFWKEEQRRRLQFYNDITEEMKAEFINGEVVVHSPARWRHVDISDHLHLLLGSYIILYSWGRIATEKAMISLTRNDYEPDLCFWRKEVAETFRPDQWQFPAPDWICEILSPSTEARDRGIKFEDYARHGVGEFWLLDEDGQTIEQYINREGQFEPLAVYRNQDRIQSPTFPELALPLEAMFDAEAGNAWLRKLYLDSGQSNTGVQQIE